MTAGTNSQEATKTNMAVRIGIGVALSVLSGVMLLLAFPPYGVWPLAWVAFVPYLFAQHRLLPRKWSSLAPAIALLLWLGPFMARLFGTEFGPIFTYLGVLIAILTYFLNREQYWTNVTFRAVENRAAMVVTARQTGSAIIDPYGRQVALNLNPDGEQVILVGDVSPGSGNTPFLYLGDWLGWLSLAGWIFFVVFQTVEKRRHKKAQEQEKADAAS